MTTLPKPLVSQHFHFLFSVRWFPGRYKMFCLPLSVQTASFSSSPDDTPATWDYPKFPLFSRTPTTPSGAMPHVDLKSMLSTLCASHTESYWPHAHQSILLTSSLPWLRIWLIVLPHPSHLHGNHKKLVVCFSKIKTYNIYSSLTSQHLDIGY